MAGGNLGVQLGRLVFAATMETVGEAALLTGEDTAKILIEYLTLMQFSASRRVSILLWNASIDSILDDIRRAGTDSLEDEGLALSRDKIEQFQKERYAQYYTVIRQDDASCPSEVLARTFLNLCAACVAHVDIWDHEKTVEYERATQNISNQLEELDYRVDALVFGFMGDSAHGGTVSLPVEIGDQDARHLQRDAAMELVISGLEQDVSDLLHLGRTLSQCTALAVVALIAGTMLLLTAAWANHHKQLRALRIRQKWLHHFSRLDADQLAAVRSELDAKHPLLLTRLGLW
jgi:hypothetical protein